MERHVALLRGINLGGHRCKMTQLKELFEELGLKDVETFIASGNVMFSTSAKNTQALEKKIETHLLKSLGFPAPAYIRTAAEMKKVLTLRPFKDGDKHTVYVAFLREKPAKASHEKLLSYGNKVDSFHVNGREAYWLTRAAGMSESPFFRVGIDKALGMPATVRNLTTVGKLVELL